MRSDFKLVLSRKWQSQVTNAVTSVHDKVINDRWLVSYLELPKVKFELLAFRMKQWKYLDEDVKISLFVIAKISGIFLQHAGHSSCMQWYGWLVQSIKHEPLLRWMEAWMNFVKAMDRNVQHFCNCDKNSPCLVMPSYERVFSLVQTFAHFFVMRHLNASLRVISREHGMPSDMWLQAF